MELKQPHEIASLYRESDLGFNNHVQQLLIVKIEVELGEAYDLTEITKRAPDLIMVSAQLNDSERAGFSLYQRIRRHETLQFVKVIITLKAIVTLHFHESTDDGQLC